MKDDTDHRKQDSARKAAKRRAATKWTRRRRYRERQDEGLKSSMRRRRRAADMQRLRSRQRRNVQLFQIEAGPEEYDLAVQYGGLREDQINDKVAISVALGRLLRRALVALLRENIRRR